MTHRIPSTEKGVVLMKNGEIGENTVDSGPVFG
jgi:hypothetical protein